MKLLLKIIGIAALVLVVLVMAAAGVLYYGLYYAKSGPKGYTETVETGGEIEAEYLKMGPYAVKRYREDAEKPMDKYLFYYPAELENSDRRYPVVLVVNGTGVFANKSRYYLEHLASWGFIVLDNYDPSTFSGESADRTLARLLELGEDSGSVFCGKVDKENIGITGHSQGGVGVFNAVQNWEHSGLYKCAVSISPTEEELANAIGMTYASSKTEIPTLLLCGRENDVISPEKLGAMYDGLKAPKAMAVRRDANHGEMLYCADGYATAWFMWRLQGDEHAGRAFAGEDPELLRNALYQDQKREEGSH